MDLENLVQRLASKIRPGTLLIVATGDLGVDLCLDQNGHWHERFRTADQNHGSGPIEKILTIFAGVRGDIRPIPEDHDFFAFAKRVGEYVEVNKQKLTEELIEALKRIDQALTS